MKDWKEIDKEMTDVTEDVTEYIEDLLSDISKEDASASEEVRGCIIRTVLNAMDNWEPKLTLAERQNVLDYVEASFGVCM